MNGDVVRDETSAAEAVRRRQSTAWWIVAVTASVVVTGMGYSLWWVPVVRHGPNGWLVAGDLLDAVRASNYIANGYMSYLYSLHTAIVTLPGFAIVFVPFVKLSEVLHLVPATSFVPILRPSEWLLIGPASMATSAVALTGLDALARTLGTSLVRRRILLVAEGAAVWPVVVLWGHPEDVLALGLGALALSRAVDGRTVAAGWLLGAALTMQLYVVLVIPVLIGLVGTRRAAPLLARAALLPGALFLAMLIPNAQGTLHAVLDQPNFPKVDHPTPWVLLAPHLGRGVVAAGPGRLIGVAAACALGFIAARYRHDRMLIVWLAAAALAARCLTEAVMDPYYVAPAIALALVAVSSRSWQRCILVAASGAALTVLTYYRPGIWWYWLEMAAAFAVMLVLSRPRWPTSRISEAAGGSPTETLEARCSSLALSAAGVMSTPANSNRVGE